MRISSRVLLLAAGFSAFGLMAGTILVLPSSSSVAVGDPVSVDVKVDGVRDLYAWQFDIIFNPSVLSAVNVTEGTLFSSAGVLFNSGTIANSAGMISFVADSLSGPGPGMSVEGTLVQILFKAVNPGSSEISLSNIILLDSNLIDITAGAIAGSIEVTRVPEPSYSAAFGVAFVAAVARQISGRSFYSARIGQRPRRVSDFESSVDQRGI